MRLMLCQSLKGEMMEERERRRAAWDGNGDGRIGRRDCCLLRCMMIVRLSTMLCMMELSSRDRIDL